MSNAWRWCTKGSVSESDQRQKGTSVFLTKHICPSAVRLVRPEGKVACKNADFWATAWWRWYLTSPANMDPVLYALLSSICIYMWCVCRERTIQFAEALEGRDTTGQFCGVNQRGPVWFLAGTISSSPAVPIHRTCAIPSNKFIFVPVLNTAWINFQTDPTFRDLEGSLALTGSFDTLVNPTLEINKKSINITAFKQESEKLIFFTGSPGDVIYSIGAPANITKFR